MKGNDYYKYRRDKFTELGLLILLPLLFLYNYQGYPTMWRSFRGSFVYYNFVI